MKSAIPTFEDAHGGFPLPPKDTIFYHRPGKFTPLHTYGIGDEVETWSNSQQRWCNGVVKIVEPDALDVEFELSGGQVGKKQIRRGHEHCVRRIAARPDIS